MVELVMEPTNKPRISENAPQPPERMGEPDAAQVQEIKLNDLVARLAAKADAMGAAYWKKSLKGQ